MHTKKYLFFEAQFLQLLHFIHSLCFYLTSKLYLNVGILIVDAIELVDGEIRIRLVLFVKASLKGIINVIRPVKKFMKRI